MNLEFENALGEILAELRDRLVRDATARAIGEPIRGGARRQWAELVRTLAELVPRGPAPYPYTLKGQHEPHLHHRRTEPVVPWRSAR